MLSSVRHQSPVGSRGRLRERLHVTIRVCLSLESVYYQVNNCDGHLTCCLNILPTNGFPLPTHHTTFIYFTKGELSNYKRRCFEHEHMIKTRWIGRKSYPDTQFVFYLLRCGSMCWWVLQFKLQLQTTIDGAFSI